MLLTLEKLFSLARGGHLYSEEFDTYLFYCSSHHEPLVLVLTVKCLDCVHCWECRASRTNSETVCANCGSIANVIVDARLYCEICDPNVHVRTSKCYTYKVQNLDLSKLRNYITDLLAGRFNSVIPSLKFDVSNLVCTRCGSPIVVNVDTNCPHCGTFAGRIVLCSDEDSCCSQRSCSSCGSTLEVGGVDLECYVDSNHYPEYAAPIDITATTPDHYNCVGNPGYHNHNWVGNPDYTNWSFVDVGDAGPLTRSTNQSAVPSRYCSVCGRFVRIDLRCEHCGACEDCGCSCSRARCESCRTVIEPSDYCAACSRCLEHCSCGSRSNLFYDIEHTIPEGFCVGVEIEVEKLTYNTPAARALNQYVRSHNIKVCRDGTIDEGLEFVTPPIEIEKFPQFITAFTQVLNKCKPKVSKQCGLHVHLDARGMTFEDLRALARLYYHVELALFVMQPRSRRENDYCKRVDRTYLRAFSDARTLYDFFLALLDSSDDCDDLSDLKAVACSSKYRWTERRFSMNLVAFLRYETVEFRMHSGTTDPHKIINWVRILCAIFNCAKLPATDLNLLLGVLDAFEYDEHRNLAILKCVTPRDKDLHGYIARRMLTFEGRTINKSRR